MTGLIMLVISVWIASIKRQFDAVNSSLTYPSLVTVVVSLVMLFTSAVGIIGGVKDKIVLLRSFLVLILMVLVVQVSVGILTFIFKEEIYSQIDDQLENSFKLYLVDADLRSAVDSIQQRFECCGLNLPHNWELNDNFTCSNPADYHSCSLPDSCCQRMKTDCASKARSGLAGREPKYQLATLRSRGVYTRGCRKIFVAWLEYNMEVLGATSLSFSILHVIGLFFVHMLIVQEEDRAQLFKYRSRYYA